MGPSMTKLNSDYTVITSDSESDFLPADNTCGLGLPPHIDTWNWKGRKVISVQLDGDMTKTCEPGGSKVNTSPETEDAKDLGDLELKSIHASLEEISKRLKHLKNKEEEDKSELITIAPATDSNWILLPPLAPVANEKTQAGNSGNPLKRKIVKGQRKPKDLLKKSGKAAGKNASKDKLSTVSVSIPQDGQQGQDQESEGLEPVKDGELPRADQETDGQKRIETAETGKEETSITSQSQPSGTSTNCGLEFRCIIVPFILVFFFLSIILIVGELEKISSSLEQLNHKLDKLQMDKDADGLRDTVEQYLASFHTFFKNIRRN